MRRVHSGDTTPEIVLRKALWSKGLRYRISPKELPGKPDIVLHAKQLAIFVDGDFWHGGQWRQRHLSALDDQFLATGSKDYWVRKIRRNMARDCAVTASLLSQGWTVLRFWESQIRHSLDQCVNLSLQVAHNDTNAHPFSLLPQKRFADFFAGIGLMRLGLEKQNWSIALANDIDQDKADMYRGNFNDASGHYLVQDIHQLAAAQIPPITLATASFPCNDLSVAGSRQGLVGKQSSAFWGFVRILERMKERRPPIVLLENVAGFLTSHKGKDLAEALSALNSLGYTVDTFIVDAVHFVPQSRRRLFVIGVLHERTCSTPATRDKSTLDESDTRPRLLLDFIFSHPEILWNIRPLPPIEATTSDLTSILDNGSQQSTEWWSSDRADYLLNQMSPRHRAKADEMIAGLSWSYGTVFRRIRKGKSMAELRTDGIAGCLRTPRGGSGRQILFKAGKGKYFARLLSPTECARLMGAHDYKISVPLNQSLFGFGDAVCVPVIEWIAKYYLDPLVNELIRGYPLTLKSRKHTP